MSHPIHLIVHFSTFFKTPFGWSVSTLSQYFNKMMHVKKNIFINFQPLIVDYLFVTSKTKMAALIKIMRTMDDWQPHSASTPAPFPSIHETCFVCLLLFHLALLRKNLRISRSTFILILYIFTFSTFIGSRKKKK